MGLKLFAGIDIGGTKCAVSIGTAVEGQVQLLAKQQFATPTDPDVAIKLLGDELEAMLALQADSRPLSGIGISCGGPLNSQLGLILSPPNLPNWHRISITEPFGERFGVPTTLQNDANACALVEWQWGAGKGTSNMIFLTFGTGMGAGLILNGSLYTGTNDMAGEVGHIRMQATGPAGYGKLGSFEGYCSGGGIAHLAQIEVMKCLQRGERPNLCRSYEQLPNITAKQVGEAANLGDELAISILQQSGEQLGAGLAILVDILNPERIVIGSIYGRQQSILEPVALAKLREEAHPLALERCEIVPAYFGEKIGDYASLSIAQYAEALAENY